MKSCPSRSSFLILPCIFSERETSPFGRSEMRYLVFESEEHGEGFLRNDMKFTVMREIHYLLRCVERKRGMGVGEETERIGSISKYKYSQKFNTLVTLLKFSRKNFKVQDSKLNQRIK